MGVFGMAGLYSLEGAAGKRFPVARDHPRSVSARPGASFGTSTTLAFRAATLGRATRRTSWPEWHASTPGELHPTMTSALIGSRNCRSDSPLSRA